MYYDDEIIRQSADMWNLFAISLKIKIAFERPKFIIWYNFYLFRLFLISEHDK